MSEGAPKGLVVLELESQLCMRSKLYFQKKLAKLHLKAKAWETGNLSKVSRWDSYAMMEVSACRSREAAASGVALTCHAVAAVGFSITCSLSEAELAKGCGRHDGPCAGSRAVLRERTPWRQQQQGALHELGMGCGGATQGRETMSMAAGWCGRESCREAA